MALFKTPTQVNAPSVNQVAPDPRQIRFLAGASVLGLVLTIALIFFFGLTLATGLALLLYILCTGLAVTALPHGHPHARVGRANAVTLIRAALAAFVAAAIVAPSAAPWLVFGVAALAFALDGVDGHLARREGLCSAFGARFDMEVDAMLGAALALVILSADRAGIEILALGFMRYAFVIASLWLPWLRGALPESLRRKAICVVQMAALLILLCPLTPMGWLLPISLSATLALAYSFAVDVIWLKKEAA